MKDEEKIIPEAEAPDTENTAETKKCADKKCGKKECKKKGDTVTFTKEEAERMESIAKELDDSREKYLRLVAEYDNFRKRTAKEKETLYGTAKAESIEPFLAIYDNLERAVAVDADNDSPHKKGIEMIFAQCKEVLEKQGVTMMEAAGKPFDPEKHNAVMHIEDENFGENIVAEVFQNGFMIGDKVLRFAVVKVAN